MTADSGRKATGNGESKTTNAATRLYLVRHGTTMLNRQNRYRGRRDVPLDEGGWSDAWSAANELEGKGISAVYASPLRRARDTARVVADGVGVDHVQDHPGLVNLDYGEWDAFTADEAKAHDPVAFEGYQNFSPGAACPGAETLDDAAQRILLTLRVMALMHPGESIAAVSHAAMVRLVITVGGNRPRNEWRYALPNGSVTVLDLMPDRLEILRIPVATAG